MKILLILSLAFSLSSFADSVEEKLLSKVPDLRQSTDYSCGASSLLAVLNYYGKTADEEELSEEMNTDPEAGTAIFEIVKAAKIRGIKSVAVEGAKIKDLENSVSRGQLTIVLGQAWRGKRLFRSMGPWEEEWDSGHYMVIIGFDKNYIYFEDPWLYGTRGYISKKEFLTRWHGHSDYDVETQRQAIFFEGTPDQSRSPLLLKNQRIK